jgi:hypothetical protein
MYKYLKLIQVIHVPSISSRTFRYHLPIPFDLSLTRDEATCTHQIEESLHHTHMWVP